MYHLPDNLSSRPAYLQHVALSTSVTTLLSISLTKRRLRTAGVALFAILILRLSVAAQVPVATIQGRITDATGAPIPRAMVTVKSKHTGWIRTTASHTDGEYQIQDLLPDDYEIRIAAPTFAATAQVQTLQVGDDKTLNFALRPGQVREQIEVRGTSPGLNLTDSEVTGSVAPVQIDNLPLNGRNFLELARLEPGVNVVSVANPGGSGNTYQRVSLPGAKFSQTRTSVDGATTNERFFAGTLINFSQESVQEFQIASFSFDPSTSSTGAGSINIASRKGGNELHGSAFFLYRDHNLAAYPGLHRNPDDPNPFFARRQSGFSISGPFRRNQFFWFANYEHNNQDGVFDIENNHPIFGKLNLIYPSPLNFDLLNIRFDAETNTKNTFFLRLSLDRNNNIAPPAAGAFMPSNWQVSGSAGTQFVAGFTSIVSPDLINDLAFSYTQLNSSLEPMTAKQCGDQASCLGVGWAEIQVFDAPAFRVGNQENAPFLRFPRTYQVVDNLTWQKRSHRLRFGGEWEHLILKGEMDIADPAVVTLWGPTNLQQFPSLYEALPVTLKDSNAPPPTFSDILQLPLRSFTMGIGNPTLPGPFNFDKASHDDELRFYLQDSWKIRTAVTLSYGLAYSYDTQVFNGDLERPAYLSPLLGDSLRPPHTPIKNFDPSVGIVWGLGKNHETIIRAGSAIYCDQVNFLATLQERSTLGPSGNGRVTIDGSLAGLSFLSSPTSFTGADLFSQLPAIRSNLTSRLGDGTDLAVREIEVLKQGNYIFAPEQTTPYAININAGIQREISQNWVLSADYVIRHYLHGGGTQLFQFGYEIDQNRFTRPTVTGVDPTTGVVSFIRDPTIPQCTPAEAAALDPSDQCSTGPINFWQNGLSYRYQALQVKLDKRFSRHLQLQISYALAKNTGFVALTRYDDNSNNYGNVGSGIGTDLTPTARHMMVANAVFEPPQHRGGSAFLRGFLNHWTLAVISEADSRPALDTLLVGLDLDGDGISNTLLPGTARHNTLGAGLSAGELRALAADYNANVYALTKRITNPDGSVTVIRPRTPFNQIINPIMLPPHFSSGDSFFSLDLRVARHLDFGEHVRATVLGEAFNLFNVANLTGYSNVLNGLTYGQPGARAGQVFGSGGPRAFQFGARLEF